MQNRMWVNGTFRKWVVNKLVNARNPDGSQALDDNDLKNYSGKVVAQVTPNHKLIASYLWNDKIRGHRRDTPPNIMEDIASVVQTNPVQTTQAEVHRDLRPAGLRVELQRDGRADQLHLSAGHGRRRDSHRRQRPSEAFFAATREEHQPNSRTSSTTSSPTA